MRIGSGSSGYGPRDAFRLGRNGMNAAQMLRQRECGPYFHGFYIIVDMCSYRRRAESLVERSSSEICI